MQEPAGWPAGADGWRRLLDAVVLENSHQNSPGELGEYTWLLVRLGPDRAGDGFPMLAQHLATCADCSADLEMLLACLREHAAETG